MLWCESRNWSVGINVSLISISHGLLLWLYTNYNRDSRNRRNIDQLVSQRVSIYVLRKNHCDTIMCRHNYRKTVCCSACVIVKSVDRFDTKIESRGKAIAHRRGLLSAFSSGIIWYHLVSLYSTCEHTCRVSSHCLSKRVMKSLDR